MDLMTRRRTLMQAAAQGPVFPVVLSVELRLNTICLNGSITSKPDWRSSGYIPVPAGAKKVRWTNYSSNTGFRAGAPETDTQTSGITMLASSAITVATGSTSRAFSVTGGEFLYISRSGRDTSAITVEFLAE